jgi:putative ABC transport system ATP-binding protein
MAGLSRPDRGDVVFEGQPVRERRTWTRLRRQRIGMIFQNFSLLPTLNAIENIQVPMFGVEKNRQTRARRAAELLDQVGLTARARHYPATLSAGERQRVAIARSLANRPSLLLADEPTGNLDSETAEAIVALLLELNRRHATTLVVVTHDLSLARRLGRTVHMHDGRIVDGPAAGRQ